MQGSPDGDAWGGTGVTEMGRWMDGLEEQAARVLPSDIYGYFRGGAGAGMGAAEASQSWDRLRLRLRPHVLRDVSACDTSTTVLGTPVGTSSWPRARCSARR